MLEPVPHNPKSLCAVWCEGFKFAKTHHYQDGAWTPGKTAFPSLVNATESAPLEGIEHLSRVLVRHEARQGVAFVRGYIGNRSQVPRRFVGGPSPDAPFVACDRQWLMVDIDKLPLPKGEGTSDSDAVDYAVSMLPDCFQGAAYHYHFSAGYRISKPGTVSLHLWFWLDRPVCCASLRAYAAGEPIFDAALYNPVQLHFTANPTIIGAEEPVKCRSGYRPGAPAVVLPDTVLDLATYTATKAEAEQRQAEERRKAAMLNRYNPRAMDSQKRYATAVVNRALSELLSAPEGWRHRAVYTTAARFGNLARYLTPEAFAQLEDAAVALMPSNRRTEAIRTVRNGYDKGLREPVDLSHIS